MKELGMSLCKVYMARAQASLVEDLVNKGTDKSTSDASASTAPITPDKSGNFDAFGSGVPSYRLLQAFFSYWHDQEKDDAPQACLIVDLAKVLVGRGWSVESLRDPSKLSLSMWCDDMGYFAITLGRMRSMLEDFIALPNWRRWVDVRHGWDQLVFDSDYLSRVAAEADDYGDHMVDVAGS
ncbi:hypothetical protein BU25DRAFT_22710 [Macroventuria anomochaeta]|uniref:Uncharacterized protein n=2 Tax=Macroventuria anomochaeta TaxID=301207 RepID=A0ACB6RPN0_9PLEO|nr:uncharacterized protein BU25DRAFT_174620 [Macroventuria anomochaeta]XP_033563677.1 uncharacterized protein BU25DRAFT_22710 [Macroventuria anomochaeta]KAF2623778.1 hypothetical protein BU25DRAFT_174620 [Macroventuria anomochaeta]KAF2629486.1 hypothetical protein BU25DRAFT_22710 [Macroventuria anomochaeta]